MIKTLIIATTFFLLGAGSHDNTGTLDPLNPFGVFKEYCYEANRLNGKAKRPKTRPWHVLPDQLRAATGITDPAIEAFLWKRKGKEGFLILKIHEYILNGIAGPDNKEHRNECSVISNRYKAETQIHDRLEELFDDKEGYADRAALAAGGVMVPAGWNVWVWSMMPLAKSTKWKLYTSAKTRRASFLYAARDLFYTRNELVHVVFMTKKKGGNVSIIRLDRTFRP